MKPRYNPLYRAYVRSLSELHSVTFVPILSTYLSLYLYILPRYKRQNACLLAVLIEVVNQINNESELDVEIINLDVLKCKTNGIRYMATESTETAVLVFVQIKHFCPLPLHSVLSGK